ncbi:MAG TPA: TolC family protein [Prolixibacteraceae bacterium]|nr:TolC family protein [Prolixibacteraceae bacterium]
MKHIGLIIAVFVIFLKTGHAQETWTLERCIEHALQQNIDLKIQQNLNEKAAYNRQQSQWELLPSVNGWGSSSFDFRRSTNQNNQITSGTTYNMSYGISASMNLFSGFTAMNSIAASRFNELAVRESSKMAENTLITSVTELFSQVLFQKNLVDIAREQLEISQYEARRIAATIAAGQLEPVAQHEIDASVSGNQLQLKRAESELQLLKLKLAQLIELPENTNFNLESESFETAQPTTYPSEISEVYLKASAHYPSILEREYQLDYYRKALHIAKGNMAPSLSLSGGYGSNFFSTDTLTNGKQTPARQQFNNYLNPSVGLSLSIPIFNGRSRNFQVKRSRIDFENAAFTLESEKKKIRREIEEALLRLENLKLEYESASDHLHFVEKSFETYREKFRLGLISTTDFMTAQNQLAVAKSDQTLAKYSWIVQRETIKLYEGNALNR